MIHRDDACPDHWPHRRLEHGHAQNLPQLHLTQQFDHLLREEVRFSLPSWAVDAIKSLADVQAWTKIGVWANIGEFNRIETTDGKLNYGFVILGLPQTEPGT